MANELVPYKKSAGNRLLFQLRWLFFTLAFLGLLFLSLEWVVAINWIVHGQYYSRMGYVAPMAMLMIAIGSPFFLALSYLTHLKQKRLTGPSSETKNIPILDLPILRYVTNEGRLRKTAFFALTATLLLVLATCYKISNLSITYYFDCLIPWATWTYRNSFEKILLPVSTLALYFFSAATLFIGAKVPTKLPGATLQSLPRGEQNDDEGETVDIVEARHEKRAACPVCRTEVLTEAHDCPRCGTVHHKECWDYAGGCAIFGCESKEKSLILREDRNFLTLKEKTNDWLQLAKVNWFGFTLATLGLVTFTWSALFPLTIYGWSIFCKMSHYFGMSAYYGGVSMSILGLIIYLLSLLPLIQRFNSLKEAASVDLQPPQGEGQRILSSLETEGMTRFILTLLFIAPAVSLTTILLLPLLFCAVPTTFTIISLHYRLAIVFMGIIFTIGLWAAARKRAIFQKSIQNRVEASLIALKDKVQ